MLSVSQIGQQGQTELLQPDDSSCLAVQKSENAYESDYLSCDTFFEACADQPPYVRPDALHYFMVNIIYDMSAFDCTI